MEINSLTPTDKIIQTEEGQRWKRFLKDRAIAQDPFWNPVKPYSSGTRRTARTWQQDYNYFKQDVEDKVFAALDLQRKFILWTLTN